MRHLIALAVLGAGLCLGAVTPASAHPTGAAVGQALMEGDGSQADAMLRAVREKPGAYPPLIFPIVAHALADRGQMAEAAKWQLFGDYRQTADIVMLAQETSEVEELRYAALALGAYNTAKDLRITDYVLSLPLDERQTLLTTVTALNADTPRLYPHDWAQTMRDGTANPLTEDWTAHPATWPERAYAMRGLVATILIPPFGRELGLYGRPRPQ